MRPKSIVLEYRDTGPCSTKRLVRLNGYRQVINIDNLLEVKRTLRFKKGDIVKVTFEKINKKRKGDD